MSKPSHRRIRSTVNYLLLLMTAVGGYVLYGIFVTPFVLPPASRATLKLETPVAPDAVDSEHYPWFKPTDWERQPCAVLLTGHGKILFKDLDRTDPKTWFVAPFSMVLNRKPDPENPGKSLPPIVLRCEKGARLKLDQPISAFSKSTFKLESAELEGAVEIYRRRPDDLLSDDLRIETSNVQINNQTVSTFDDVAFWFGGHQGMGRQMTLSLSHTNTVAQKDFSAINGITNLRLALLSSMQLNPPAKTKAGNNRMLSTDNAPIQILTDGDFEFNFFNNIAKFRNKVRVRKMDAFGDQLDCDELLLKFKAADDKKFVELDSATDNQFELQNIVAKGAPALLTARSQNAQIQGEILKYELDQQFVQATAQSHVTVVRSETQFVAKSIQYRLTDDGRLGPLSAVGPGHLIKQDPKDPFRASWATLLTVKRKNENQHLIQLQGKAKLNLGANTELTSNRIKLTIWEVPVFDWQGNFVRWTQQPAELNAKKRVHISSENLVADSEELIATWPANPREIHLPKEPDNVLGHRGHQANDHALLAATPVSRVRRVNYDFVQQEKKLPLLASGKLIQVQIDESKNESKISDMQILGDVQVRKPSAKQPNQFEFTVIGDSLHLTPQANENYRVQVSGAEQFAQIISDRFNIEGEEVFLDQSGNQMWINGRGRVVLDSPASIESGQGRQRTSKMNIEFAGGMIFDGRNIYFEYGIDAKIREQRLDGFSTTSATGNALKIILDRQVDFNNLDDTSVNSDPQIVEMIFRSTPPEGQAQFKFAGFNKRENKFVFIESEKQDRSGNIVEKIKLVSPHAVVNRLENKLTAHGPGGIEIYRKGRPGKPSSGFGFIGDPATGSGASSITYVHTHFDHQLVSGLESKDLKVVGNVRSLYAPVQDFIQSIDPSRPKSTPPGTVRLFCDQIDLVQSSQPFTDQPKSQFVATGNAQIAADRFASRGDRISFRDDTENLVVESLTGKNVVLRLRNNAQSDFDKGIVNSKLIYNLRTKTVQAKDVDSLSASINKRP